MVMMGYAQKRSKRKLIDSVDETFQEALRQKRSRITHGRRTLLSAITSSEIRDDETCARLITMTTAGSREAILISITKPVAIGRNPNECSYIIKDIIVSGVHFKVSAIRSTSGAILLSCTDTSTNGTQLNGHLIKNTSVIIVHGDVLKIPSSQSFKCIYTMPALRLRKQTLFDPTPPLASVNKVIGIHELTVGKYRVTSCTLGSGTFAIVNLGYTMGRTHAYKQVACKMLKMTDDSEKNKLMQEVQLLRKLSHPNINHILDVVTKDGFLNIFLDLSTGGDLFSYITSRRLKRLKEGEARFCGFQLMLGLKYLHERNVSHRDLKPENILLHAPGSFPRLIIADFGLARPRAHEQTFNAVGTLSYMPPEAIRALTTPHHGYVGIYADAWSLGLVLHTMLCGYHPFDSSEAASQHTTSERGDARVMMRIVEGPIVLEDELWDTIPNACELVEKLLVHDPLRRETIYGALASTWICSALSDLKKWYLERVGPCK